jgi:PAS domain S-box-containing protein
MFLIPLIILGIGINYIAAFYTKKELAAKNTLLIKSISMRINQYVENSYEYLDSVAEFISITGSISDNNVNLFIHKTMNYTSFESIILLDENGRLVNSEPVYNKLKGYDYSKYDFFKNYSEKNKKYQIYWENEENKIYIIIKFEKNGKPGFITGILNLNEIKIITEDISNPDSGINIVISDNDNNIIFNPKNISLDKKIIILMSTAGYIENVKINNKKYILFSDNRELTGWNLIFLERQDLAYALISMMRYLTLISYLFCLLFTVISILAGFIFLLKPLFNFVNETALAAGGKYQIKFHKYFIKEINTLSINFNKMLTQLLNREKEIKKSEIKYKKLVEESLDFIFKISDDYKFSFLSQSIENILGCKREEFLENIDSFFEIRNKMNLKARMIIREVFLKKTHPDPFLVNVIQKSGEKIILEIQATPVIQNKRVVEIQCTARDITTRYHVEQEVIYLKNYLYNVIESMPSVLITLDNNGCVQQFNSAACRFIDKLPDEIYDKILWPLSERFEVYEKYYNEAASKNTQIEFHDNYKNPNKELKVYNAAFFPLKWDGMKGMVLRIDDITNIEKTEMQLRQSQKLETIGTMASGLAHDFNNILGAIIGTLTLIEYKAKNYETMTYNMLKEDLDVIAEASKKAVGIIQQLMSLSKSRNVIMETVDIKKEISDVVKLCSTTFPKSIQITTNLPDEPSWAEASSSQIGQMILNLLVNAKDSIKETGNINVSLEKVFSDSVPQDKNPSQELLPYWLITISDNGKGIPQNIRDLIFDPFFSTKGKFKGTGLGLTIVYNIIKNHKGHIQFDTEVNKGTSFKIYLPFKEMQRKTEKESRDVLLLKGHGTILVVDDERNIRSATKKILKECGYNIITAKDGNEAIKIFNEKHKQIDAVLLDLVMPGKSGYEVFLEMKKIYDKVKVMLVTGAKYDSRIQEILDMGVKHYLIKPFSFNELSNMVYNLINEKL